MAALDEIAAERRRQIEAECWSADHDDAYLNGELARAAGCYALAAADTKPLEASVAVNFAGRWLPAGTFFLATLAWPWANRWWKPKTPRENLIRAGALIVAEIERLDRLAAKQTKDGTP